MTYHYTQNVNFVCIYTCRCFLSPMTHFIWAFISPVILIILLNFVFFIIVARVMWRHQKKLTENSQKENIRYIAIYIYIHSPALCTVLACYNKYIYF